MRCILLIVAAALCAPTITACTGQDDDRPRIGGARDGAGAGSGASAEETGPTGEPVTLTLWHAYRDDERAAIESAIERYNAEHPGITVESLAVPFDAYPDRLSAAIPRGRGPDMFIFAHDRVGNWAEEGIIEPVNFWTDSELLARFYDVTVQALVYERRLFGLPIAFKSLVLFYNRDLVPTPPTTTDELIRVARSHTDSSGEGTYGFVYENTKLYFHAPWLHGFGGSVLDGEDGLHVNDSEAVAALRFAASLHQEHHLLPENVFSQTVTSLFNSGRAAMVMNGPWFRGELQDVNWGVAPLPTISETGEPARPFLSVEAMMISAQSSNQELAFEAIRWFATDPEAVAIRMERGHQPVTLRSAFDGEVDPVMRAFEQQMLLAIPTPNTPLMRQVWSHMDTALFRSIKNRDDPVTVLEEARSRIEADRER